MENQVVSSVLGFSTTDLKLKGFKVYEIETAVSPVPKYSRRDFYKICMDFRKDDDSLCRQGY